MAAYTPRTRARNFSEREKILMENLWGSGELRGISEYYSPVIQRTADQLGRSIKEIKVSELACIIIVNLL